MMNEGAPPKTLLYGLDEIDGLILVEPLLALVPDDACRMQGVAMAKLGRFVYTDAVLGHDGLVFEMPSRSWDCKPKLEQRGRLRHCRLQEFWGFTAEALARRGWLSQSPFHLALHELQFRYNHRGGDTCDMIVEILAQPMLAVWEAHEG